MVLSVARFGNLFAVMSGVMLLVGCADDPVRLGTASNTSPPIQDFEQTLYAGYLNLSQAEYGENDVDAGRFFATRAVDVAQGDTVLPELIENRDLPADKVGDLASARNRLMAALDATARTKVPVFAGRAQVMFDCWIQEQEENFQPDDIAACRAGFEDAIVQVEDRLRAMAQPEPRAEPPMEVAPTPLEPEPAPTVGAPMPGPFLVFFDFNKSDLTSEALGILETIAQAAMERQAEQIVVIGHADRSGTETYNLALSNRRAAVVADELRRLGLTGQLIDAFGKGETEPLVPTADGVREPQNRRAAIILQ